MTNTLPGEEARALHIDREMTADLDRRRVLTLARLSLMLDQMARDGMSLYGVGPTHDIEELYGETLMALGIEDEDRPETMAEVIVEMDGNSGHGILDRLAHQSPSRAAGEGLREAVERFIADYDDDDRADAGCGALMEAHIADFRAGLATPQTAPANAELSGREVLVQRMEALVQKMAALSPRLSKSLYLGKDGALFVEAAQIASLLTEQERG